MEQHQAEDLATETAKAVTQTAFNEAGRAAASCPSR